MHSLDCQNMRWLPKRLFWNFCFAMQQHVYNGISQGILSCIVVHTVCNLDPGLEQEQDSSETVSNFCGVNGNGWIMHTNVLWNNQYVTLQNKVMDIDGSFALKTRSRDRYDFASIRMPTYTRWEEIDHSCHIEDSWMFVRLTVASKVSEDWAQILRRATWIHVWHKSRNP